MRQELNFAGKKVVVSGLGDSVSCDEPRRCGGRAPQHVRESGQPDDRVHELGGLPVRGVGDRAGRRVLRSAAECGGRGEADRRSGPQPGREAARVMSLGADMQQVRATDQAGNVTPKINSSFRAKCHYRLNLLSNRCRFLKDDR